MSDRKTILLVDDHTLFRKGLKLLLDQNPNFNVVGEAATIADASGIAKMAQPQIVLMDIALPDHNGIEGTRRILRLSPASKVVVISMYAKMWEASGLAYPVLVDRLVDLALERHERKSSLS